MIFDDRRRRRSGRRVVRRRRAVGDSPVVGAAPAWDCFAASAADRLGRDLRRAGAAGRGDRGDDQALDQRRRAEHAPAPARRGSSRSSASSADSTALPRSIRTTTPAPSSAAVIASTIAVASVPNVVVVEPGGDLDPHLAAVQHLGGQRDRGVGQRPAVRDDDEAGHRRLSLRRARGRGGDEQRRRRRARVLVADAALAEVAARPLRASIGIVASRPASAAAAAARPAPRPGRRPRRAPRLARRTAGASASNMVLSPASALPRATTPSSPARSAAANAGRVERLGVAGAGRPSAGRACRRAGRWPRRPC